MLIGIMLCALHFAYEYTVMQLVTFTVSSSTSNSMLPIRHQLVLFCLRQANLRAMSISGMCSVLDACMALCILLLSATNCFVCAACGIDFATAFVSGLLTCV
jgi:hypothetical protein